MAASNDAQLLAMLAKPTLVALDNVGKDLEDDIKNQVQGVLAGSDWYDGGGAGSLQEAWKTEPASLKGNSVEVEMKYDNSLLSFNPESWQHSSLYGGNVSNMADLIIEGGGGPIFGEGNPTRTPRDFWTPFENTLSATMDGKIKSALASAGLPVI